MTLDMLTEREQQIGEMIAGGLVNKEIAVQLHTSEGNTKRLIMCLMAKLGATNRAHVAAKITRMEMI